LNRTCEYTRLSITGGSQCKLPGAVGPAASGDCGTEELCAMACSCTVAEAVVCADPTEDISPIELATNRGTRNRK
jgi:hypothetical protein